MAAKNHAGSHGMARTGDPQTSKDAAASVVNLRASQARVLNIFKAYGDLTDDQLLEYLHDLERNLRISIMSPSGARSRRSELSKPNMDRLDEIAAEMGQEATGLPGLVLGDLTAGDQVRARERLRTEGFRSPLWDTGERRKLASGRMSIVWGLAK